MDSERNYTGSLPKPKNLHLSLKDCDATSGKSPNISMSYSSGKVYSPVTDLAMNLGELTTTGFGGTPKRKLSLSSTGTPTPMRPAGLLFQKQLSYDAGIGLDSTSPVDSPFLENSSFLKNPTLQRFQSMPVPFCGFEVSPSDTSQSEAKLSSVTSPACRNLDMSPTHSALASPPMKSVSPFGKLSPSRRLMSPKALSPCGSKISVPLDEDESSQDSGVCMDVKDKVFDSDFRFVEPIAPPPRRMRILSDETNSPKHFSPFKSSPQRSFSLSSSTVSYSKDDTSPVKLRRSSLTTSPATDEGDDGFLELLDDEDQQDLSQVPQGMKCLFTKPDLSAMQPSPGRKSVRRGLMLDECQNGRQKENEENVKPKKKFSRGLFRSPSAPIVPKLLLEKSKSFGIRMRAVSYKREPSRDGEDTPQSYKRRKSVVEKEEEKRVAKPSPKFKLQRCHSASEAMIKSAMNRCDMHDDLIGDFSKSYILPLIPGKHQDLKSISADTLAAVLNGEYDDVIGKTIIVDCRYPYEYDGGHIRGAKNYYTKDDIMEAFLLNGKPDKFRCTDSKRTIIVFHCEFSSERGPKMFRFLRNNDREANKDCYPVLYYPEVYLLDGGYKHFFQTQKHICVPQTYLEMADKNYTEQYKLFRGKTKCCNAERQGRVSLRLGHKF